MFLPNYGSVAGEALAAHYKSLDILDKYYPIPSRAMSAIAPSDKASRPRCQRADLPGPAGRMVQQRWVWGRAPPRSFLHIPTRHANCVPPAGSGVQTSTSVLHGLTANPRVVAPLALSHAGRSPTRRYSGVGPRVSIVRLSCPRPARDLPAFYICGSAHRLLKHSHTVRTPTFLHLPPSLRSTTRSTVRPSHLGVRARLDG